MAVVTDVTLPLLPCLGEAKRSPRGPWTLQGNGGSPLCMQQVTQRIPLTAQGMGFLSRPLNPRTVWLEVTFQWVPAVPDPILPYPDPSPMAHVTPVLASIFTAATQLWAGLS